MKLGAKKMVLVSFMLFSLFFGAGNLIFPPFLGQNAGSATPLAFFGFLVTAVLLPVLGVIVVAKFGGLENLGRLVSRPFAIGFTVIIYLSIGPGLGIPRAASVPFEMAVAPYLPKDSNLALFMAIYSLVFFLIALWLCLTPGKLVKRIGSFLTPTLLTLLVILFVAFLCKGKTNVAPPQDAYKSGAFMQGFIDGYQTMDAIAALNFGLVIATTLTAFGVKEKKGIMKHTIVAGIIAGSVLTFIYFTLAFIGAQSSGIYAVDENGAVLLRHVVEQLFGKPGAILLGAIFTLACLTTCVGLINSISSYFAMLFKKVSYRKWVIIITVISFLICNLGLNTILSISVPVLNIVYPISIALIFFGLTSKLFVNMKAIYPATISGIAVVSVLHSLTTIKEFHGLGAFGAFLNKLPWFETGFFWVIVALVIMAITLAVYGIIFLVKKYGKKNTALATECACDTTADATSVEKNCNGEDTTYICNSDGADDALADETLTCNAEENEQGTSSDATSSSEETHD